VRPLLLLIATPLFACSPTDSNHFGDGGVGEEIVLLPFPDDGGLTWDAWTGAFVRDYCVECHSPSAPCGGSGCHSAGDPALFDFHDETQVIARAPTIQCGIATQQDPSWNCGSTAPKTFPLENGGNPLPTDPQRALVVQWIDAGCP
jgi:hypothetical protein